MKRRSLAGLPLFVLLLPLAGCTLQAKVGVEPWERGELARRCMRLDGYALEAALDDHIYFSKEASSGGASFAGGGCGCN
jgi:hypothetical protein